MALLASLMVSVGALAQELDDDAPRLVVPPSAKLTLNEKNERLHILEQRDSGARACKVAALGAFGVGLLFGIDWALAVTGTHAELLQLFGKALDPNGPGTVTGIPDGWRDPFLATTLSLFVTAGLLAVASAWLGWGVDAERAELQRNYREPRSAEEERRALGLTE